MTSDTRQTLLRTLGAAAILAGMPCRNGGIALGLPALEWSGVALFAGGWAAQGAAEYHDAQAPGRHANLANFGGAIAAAVGAIAFAMMLKMNGMDLGRTARSPAGASALALFLGGWVAILGGTAAQTHEGKISNTHAALKAAGVAAIITGLMLRAPQCARLVRRGVPCLADTPSMGVFGAGWLMYTAAAMA